MPRPVPATTGSGPDQFRPRPVPATTGRSPSEQEPVGAGAFRAGTGRGRNRSGPELVGAQIVYEVLIFFVFFLLTKSEFNYTNPKVVGGGGGATVGRLPKGGWPPHLQRLSE